MQPQPNAPVLPTHLVTREDSWRIVSRRGSRDPGTDKGAILIANTQAFNEAILWPRVVANSSPKAGTVFQLHELHDQSAREASGDLTAAVAPATGVHSQRSDDQIEAVTREQQPTNKVSDAIPF